MIQEVNFCLNGEKTTKRNKYGVIVNILKYSLILIPLLRDAIVVHTAVYNSFHILAFLPIYSALSFPMPKHLLSYTLLIFETRA